MKNLWIVFCPSCPWAKYFFLLLSWPAKSHSGQVHGFPCVPAFVAGDQKQIRGLCFSTALYFIQKTKKKSWKMCIIGTLASILSNPCCLLENSWVTEDVLGQFSAVSLMLGASMKEVLSGFQRLCKIRLALNPDSRTGTKFLVIKSLAFDPPLHFPWFGW